MIEVTALLAFGVLGVISLWMGSAHEAFLRRYRVIGGDEAKRQTIAPTGDESWHEADLHPGTWIGQSPRRTLGSYRALLSAHPDAATEALRVESLKRTAVFFVSFVVLFAVLVAISGGGLR